jgi:dsRNA-specific ribonuclease
MHLWMIRNAQQKFKCFNTSHRTTNYSSQTRQSYEIGKNPHVIVKPFDSMDAATRIHRSMKLKFPIETMHHIIVSHNVPQSKRLNALGKYAIKLMGRFQVCSVNSDNNNLGKNPDHIVSHKSLFRYANRLRIPRVMRMKLGEERRIINLIYTIVGASYVSGGISEVNKLVSTWGSEWEQNISQCFTSNEYESDELKEIWESGNFSVLEQRIGYKFKRRELLVQAMTHASFSHIPNCSFLEFIGDAVLDLMLMEYIVNTNQLNHDDMMDKLRQKSTTNAILAHLSVKRCIHEHVITRPESKQAIDKYCNKILQCVPGSSLPQDYPKFLADTYEALAAAVFIDSGYNLDAVYASMGLQSIPRSHKRNMKDILQFHNL